MPSRLGAFKTVSKVLKVVDKLIPIPLTFRLIHRYR